ncbi:armadillo-type protein [Sporodiniella umbellata]|nr:armadillo-type protein [Sporodiniella umbellata]
MESIQHLDFEKKQILLNSSKCLSLKKRNSILSSRVFSLFSFLKLSLKNTLGHKLASSSDICRRMTAHHHPQGMLQSKPRSTPDYFVHMLKTTHFGNLVESELLDLRMFLRSVIISWTNRFLILGGYESMSDLLKQAQDITLCFDFNANRKLQHLTQCLKTIMSHVGTAVVLANPVALVHVRDLVFANLPGLYTSTQNCMLHLLFSLTILQTEQVNGYQLLCLLLKDHPVSSQYPYTAWMNALLSVAHLYLQQAPIELSGEESRVDYIIYHLRLMCAVVTCLDSTEEEAPEKIRTELMQSGLTQVIKILQQTPDATLFDPFLHYLQPLISIPPKHTSWTEEMLEDEEHVSQFSFYTKEDAEEYDQFSSESAFDIHSTSSLNVSQIY